MVAAVTAAAATVPCAKRQHNHCAAPDFPSFVQTMRFVQHTFICVSHSGCPRTASSEPERGAVAVLMARFASPPLFPKISFYTVILSAKKPVYWTTMGQLDLIKGKAKYKLHLSRRIREAPSYGLQHGRGVRRKNELTRVKYTQRQGAVIPQRRPSSPW